MAQPNVTEKVEIERRFLVIGPVPEPQKRKSILQGYLRIDGRNIGRIRFDGSAWVRNTKETIDSLSVVEREETVSAQEGQALLLQSKGVIVRKERSFIPAAEAGLVWEVDLYEAPMRGLLVAEIELPTRDYAFTRPAWLGPEITGDKRFSNAALSRLKPKDEKKLWAVIETLLADWPNASAAFKGGAPARKKPDRHYKPY